MIVTAQLLASSGDTAYASFQATGGCSVTAADGNALIRSGGASSSTGAVQASTETLVTGCTTASTVFSMAYKESPAVAQSWSNRTLTVIPLN